MKKAYFYGLFVCLLMIMQQPTQAMSYPKMNAYMEKLVKYKTWKSDKKTDYYKLKKGTILVTPDLYKGKFPLGHSAIVYSKEKVIEAVKEGVVLGANHWVRDKRYTIALRVKGLNDKQHNQAADYAYKQKGKPYTVWFYDTATRNFWYCSKLVWASFYDLFKVNIDTKEWKQAGKDKVAMIHPMELVASTLTQKVFYYDKGK